MGKYTKIDWCDSSWSPVTGCLHGCKYCYARGIARRFSGGFESFPVMAHELSQPMKKDGKVMPYPFGFDPTFHRYRLDEPQKWKHPRTIFVCSMSDLFGKWVPEEWIESVLDACRKAPQHRYLFLTKNPIRYIELAEKGLLPDADGFWYGSTTTDADMEAFFSKKHNTFLSIEPILKRFGAGNKGNSVDRAGWVIIGAETGNRKSKVIPEKSWITELVDECRKYKKPVFMKESLREIMGSDFVQEFPWGQAHG